MHRECHLALQKESIQVSGQRLARPQLGLLELLPNRGVRIGLHQMVPVAVFVERMVERKALGNHFLQTRQIVGGAFLLRVGATTATATASGRCYFVVVGVASARAIRMTRDVRVLAGLALRAPLGVHSERREATTTDDLTLMINKSTSYPRV